MLTQILSKASMFFRLSDSWSPEARTRSYDSGMLLQPSIHQTFVFHNDIFRDISQPENRNPLRGVGSISAHTRPVECLDGQALSENSAILYTGDTMGVIKVWDLQKDNGSPPRWAATLKDTINHHRTRINELMYHQNGHLWTGVFSFFVAWSYFMLILIQPPRTKLSASWLANRRIQTKRFPRILNLSHILLLSEPSFPFHLLTSASHISSRVQGIP